LIKRARSSALTTKQSSFASKLRSSAKSLRISRVVYRSTVMILAMLSYSLNSRLRCLKSESVKRKL
jgi:hypothetical protein